MKKMRKNNKGFTLVELIIVVAIIAILTVAVAPQYLKYVEKSREASDLNAIEEVISVMNVAVADPANTSVSDGKLTLVCSSGEVVLTEDASDPTGVVALVQGTPAAGGAAAVPGMIDMPKIQSKDGKLVSLTITVDLDGNGISIDDAGQALLDALSA